MTSTWDQVQRLIGALGELKDPEIYSTGLEYISNLISEIHEFDHKNKEAVSHAIHFSTSMEDIRKLLGKAKPR